jgi:hypothetical protein
MTKTEPSTALRKEASAARRAARAISDPLLAQIMNTLANGCEVRAMFQELGRADQSSR